MAAWSKEKCANFKKNFLNFLKYVRVNSKEQGNICLGDCVYRAQMKFLDEILDGLSKDIHDIKAGKSRQLGISTFSRALTLFWIGVHDGLRGYMIFDTTAHTEEARIELVEMLKSLPPELGFPTLQKENRYMIRLSNQSAITFASAGVRAGKSSGTLGRSSGVNFVHASEVCSWDNVEGLEAFRNALAEDFDNRLYIWESTARGFNAWHEMWEEAKADPDHQKTVFLGWHAKDNQMIARDHPDFKKYGEPPPTEEEMKKIKAVLNQYGWQVTQEQLAWYRRKTDPSQQDSEGTEVDPLKIQEQPWCVTRETRVGTDHGLIRIEDAKVGMIGTVGTLVMAGPTGMSEIWQAKTYLGYRVRGTPNHPLIGVDGDEIRLDQSLGQKVKLCPPKFADSQYTSTWKNGPVECRVDITPDFARLIGIYMGDGSLSGAGKNGGAGVFSVCCDAKDQDVAQEVRRLLNATFGVNAGLRNMRGWTDVRVGSKLIVETFRAMGLTRNDTSKTMRKVHVPEFIWRSPKHIVKEFLSGLFEADGFNDKSNYRCVIFSKYEEFLQDIQLLLLGFGITSRFSTHVKNRTQRQFIGHSLELRKAEAKKFNDEIGFLSERKRTIHFHHKENYAIKKQRKKEIILEDEVVSVFNEGRIEEVFNLTVDGCHLFDANGVLTHNTEEEMFQQTGATFFPPETLTEITNNTASKKYKAYSYYTGGVEFRESRIFPAHNAKSTELKVWEEPVTDSVYVIAADVAFGHSEKNDRSAIQVLRCFADEIEQVAEYAWPLISSRQFAWVIASLMGWYGGADKTEIYLIVEINGPGEATWNELQSLKRELSAPYQLQQMQELGLANIFQNVRNYIYTRSDSMSQGQSLMWKTNLQLKVSIMERLRDFTMNKKLVIRSHDTIEEMKAVTRDGDSIEAQGSKKDDRVISLAMGIRCWEERIRRNMIAQRRTRQFEESKRRMSIRDQITMFNENQLSMFFAKKAVDKRRAAQMAARQQWRGRR